MRGFCGIGLHRAKTPSNVGMVLRASKCFGAEFVAVSGMRYSKSRTDPQKSFKSMPLFEVEDLQSIIPFGATPVAVDLLPDARPIKITSILNEPFTFSGRKMEHSCRMLRAIAGIRFTSQRSSA